MHRSSALLLATAATSVVTSVVTSVGLTAAPASADPGHTIGFSRNGHHWSDNLGAPLFDPSLRWVPGDVREVRFFVRNERPDAGRLRLAVMDSSRDALRESRYLRVAAKVGDAPWDSVTAPGRQLLADRLRIRGDDRPVEVKVRVRFLEDAPNVTMHLPTDLGFRVVLSDATAVGAAEGTVEGGVADGGPAGGSGTSGTSGAVGTSSGTASGGGSDLASGAVGSGLATGTVTSGSAADLPATGSMVPGWLTPAALLLVGAGALLLARRRPEPAIVLAEDVEEVPRG